MNKQKKKIILLWKVAMLAMQEKNWKETKTTREYCLYVLIIAYVEMCRVS